MRPPARVLTILSMCICLTASASDVESKYHLLNWQIEHGLPQNSVRLITQTIDGYLWVSTLNALARFDGRQFKVFYRSEIPGLQDKAVSCLYGDRVGRLWIGAQQRLLCYFRGEFSTYEPPDGQDVGEFSGIAEDLSGELFALTWHGLCRIDTARGRLVHVPNPLGKSGGAKLLGDARGRIWVASGNTLSWFENGQWRVRASLPFIIHALFTDPAETIWCGLNGGSIVQVTPDGSTRSFQVGGATVSGIVQSDYSGLLFRMDQNLYQFPTGEPLRLTLPNSRPVGRILDVFRDREGNIWAGSDGDGLILLRSKPLTAYSSEQGLSDRHVTSIMEDKEKRIWCGTMASGIAMLDSGTWRKVEFPQGRSIGALLQTHDGSVWVGTFGRHLWQLRNGQPHLETRSRALACRALFEDKSGGVWIGGDGAGVECLKDGKVTRYDTGHGLLTVRTRCFAEHNDGSIWVGTEQGLYRIDSDRVQGFFVRDGLGANAIQTLFVDSAGTLWIGTDDGGLTRYRDHRFATVTTRHGLLHDIVVQIAEDDQANLWLGTSRGLLRVSRANLNTVLDGRAPRLSGRVFGKAEGMRNLECTGGFQPNCLKSSDGRLWFATIDGLVVVDPNNLPISQVPPPVHIERLVADGTELLSERSPVAALVSGVPNRANVRSLTERQASEAALSVPAGAKRIEIHYTGISFSNTDRVRFKYKLEGYDPEWNESDSLTMASYTRVPPGQYQFRVQAANSDGVWNPHLAELSFRVRAALWQTWWFRTSAGLTAGLLIFAVSYGPIQRRRQMERLRLRIARDLHDEVGSHLGTISLYNQLAQSKTRSDPSATPEFQEIDRVVQRTAQSLRDVIWFINPEFDTLNGMLQHMEDAAHRALVGKTVVFQVDSPIQSRHLPVEFRRNMFLIFRELMHNILKHSQATRVQIAVAERNKQLVVNVTDDGVGFDPLSGRKGHGLKNMKQRTAELGGSIVMDSQPGKGTRIRLEVPLK